MSDLPTLYVPDEEIYQLEPGQARPWAYVTRDEAERADAGKVHEYVPASRLAAAEAERDAAVQRAVKAEARVDAAEKQVDRKKWIIGRIEEELVRMGTPLNWADGGGSAAPHGWHRNPYLNWGHIPTIVKERDALRADLARVAAERDEARAQVEAMKPRVIAAPPMQFDDDSEPVAAAAPTPSTKETT